MPMQTMQKQSLLRKEASMIY